MSAHLTCRLLPSCVDLQITHPPTSDTVREVLYGFDVVCVLVLTAEILLKVIATEPKCGTASENLQLWGHTALIVAMFVMMCFRSDTMDGEGSVLWALLRTSRVIHGCRLLIRRPSLEEEEESEEGEEGGHADDRVLGSPRGHRHGHSTGSGTGATPAGTTPAGSHPPAPPSRARTPATPPVRAVRVAGHAAGGGNGGNGGNGGGGSGGTPRRHGGAGMFRTHSSGRGGNFARAARRVITARSSAGGSGRQRTGSAARKSSRRRRPPSVPRDATEIANPLRQAQRAPAQAQGQ